MERTGNDVALLFLREGDEFHGVARHADREVCVFRFFRMFHGIDQHFLAKDVDVQVMCALIEIAVKDVD